MRLFSLFSKNKKSFNEFDRLNNTCNDVFEAAFSICRLDFGREMVEIMDLKSRLVQAVKSKIALSPAQDLLAKKFLELVPVYFKVVEIYISLKKDTNLDKSQSQSLSEIEEKMVRVYSLIHNLNSQFYFNSDEVSGMSGFDEIINEAEALRNVINKNYLK